MYRRNPPVHSSTGAQADRFGGEALVMSRGGPACKPDDFGGPWVQIDGDAEVIDVPAAVEPLVSYYRAIAGEHADWAEYRAGMLRQGKSLLRVTPRRCSPVATGGFPPELA
jgi:hypothetical protein